MTIIIFGLFSHGSTYETFATLRFKELQKAKKEELYRFICDIFTAVPQSLKTTKKRTKEYLREIETNFFENYVFYSDYNSNKVMQKKREGITIEMSKYVKQPITYECETRNNTRSQWNSFMKHLCRSILHSALRIAARFLSFINACNESPYILQTNESVYYDKMENMDTKSAFKELSDALDPYILLLMNQRTMFQLSTYASSTNNFHSCMAATATS